MTTTAITTCPSWCVKHPENDQDTHQAAHWHDDGFDVSMEQSPGDPSATICIDHGVSESMDVTPAEARVLAAKLVEFADLTEVA